jgi:PHD/YefM family antitoxin component YafN of YafNO toxin-antitoxin module
METTTIQINKDLKKELDSLKVHSRETYNDLILRLINNGNSEEDKESLIETIEILSNPETMRNIAEALEEIEKGDYGIPFKKIKEEFNVI